MRSLPLISSLALSLIPLPALAQSITPAADGTGTLVLPNGTTYTITGGSLSRDGGNLFHSFEQFGLTANEVATFLASPNVQNILGRVVGGNASLIDGRIQVNGGANLYLINPAGILFGPNTVLNLDGSFTATSASGVGFGNAWLHALEPSDYGNLTGNPTAFSFADHAGAIINSGNLAVGTGENLTLMGGSVVNLGTLEAPGGQITVMAVPGENLVILRPVGALLGIELAPLPNGAPNLTGISPLDIPGLLRAGEPDIATGMITHADGTVSLVGSSLRLPTVPGTAIASGTLSVAGEQGGTVQILGDRVAVVGATIEASGTQGGGQVLIGGEYQGQGTTPTANRTFMDATSTITANAGETGNGGEVILWAEEATQFDGTITAQGGTTGGDGGFVEVSGRQTLGFNGFVDVSAPNGKMGTLLLDPEDIFIVAGASDPNPPPFTVGSLGESTIFAATPPATITINSSTLEALTANVRLEATRNITIENGLSLNFAPGAGSITFIADADNNRVGDFSMDITQSINAQGDATHNGRDITISGVNITVGNISTSVTSPGSTTSGGSITLSSLNKFPITLGDITAGTLDSSTAGTGNGGAISVLNDFGATTLTSARSFSQGGTAGNISLRANLRDFTVGLVNAGTATGTAGNVTIEQNNGGAVTTGNIVGNRIQAFTFSAADFTFGNITATSSIFLSNRGGSLTTGNLLTTTDGISVGSGNGGTVQLGNVTAGDSISLSTGSNGTITTGNLSAGTQINATTGSGGTLTLGEMSSGPGIFGLSINLQADEINFVGGSGTVQAPGRLLIQTATAAQPIILGGTGDSGAGALDLTATDIAALANGFSDIVIGGTFTVGTGPISLAGNLAFADPLILRTNGTINTTNGILTGTGDASFTLEAGAGITAGSIQTAGNTVTLTGDRDSDGDGSVSITGPITTNGGDITISGAAIEGAGVDLIGTGSLNSGGGNITINGTGIGPSLSEAGIALNGNVNSQGGDIRLTGVSSNGAGVVAFQLASILAGGGDVTIEGTSSTYDGIQFLGALDSQSGDVTLTGNTAGRIGILLAGGSLTSGGGNISVAGTATGTTPFSPGVVTQENFTITSNGGNITLTGQGSRNDGGLLLGGNSTIDAGTGSMVIKTDDSRFFDVAFQGQGTLNVLPLTPNLTLRLGGTGDRTLFLNAEEIARFVDGFSRITIGSSTGTGDIVFEGDAAFSDPTVLTTLGNINTQGFNLTGTNNASFTLLSGGGAITASDITVPGGSITLQASGPVLAGNLNTSGPVGGAVSLTSGDRIQVNTINAGGDSVGGSITATAATTFQALGSFLARNGVVASLSTVGGTQGGPISLTYNTSEFTIGDATINGTQAAITTGDVTLLPNQVVIGSQVFGSGLPGQVSFIAPGEPELPPPPPPPPPSEDVPEPVLDNEIILDEEIDVLLEEAEQSEDEDEQPALLTNTGETFQDSEFSDIEAEIASEFSNHFGSAFRAPRPVSLAEAQNTLRDIQAQTGEVPALVYVRFNRQASQGSGQGALELLLVSPNGDPVRVQVLSVNPRAVIRAQELLRRQLTNPNLTNNQDYLIPAQQLYNWIIAPIRRELETAGITNLSFIMDAGLRTLPLAALHDGERFLLETYSVGLMPSLGLIDPTYVNLNRQNATMLLGGASQFLSQPPLLAARTELETLQSFWPSNALVEGNFTVDALRQGRRQAQIVHLATHAEFLRGAPNQSYIQFSEGRLSLDKMADLRWFDPPVDLVTLSACQTAMGNLQAELGFAGFALQAGARSALASLWRVSDEATAGLMTTFYQQLDQQTTKTEALRQAQLAFIRGEATIENGAIRWPGGTVPLPPNLAFSGTQDLSHPFYWAAFSIVGSPW